MNANNPFQFIQMFQSAKNPQQLFVSLLESNPRYKTTLQQMKNSADGASYETIARQLAEKQGISEQQLMQMYNMLNPKK